MPQKPPLSRKKKKRAVLIAIKDNGLGMSSAISTSIPAPYNHTQTREILEILYPILSPRGRN